MERRIRMLHGINLEQKPAAKNIKNYIAFLKGIEIKK